MDLCFLTSKMRNINSLLSPMLRNKLDIHPNYQMDLINYKMTINQNTLMINQFQLSKCQGHQMKKTERAVFLKLKDKKI